MINRDYFIDQPHLALSDILRRFAGVHLALAGLCLIFVYILSSILSSLSGVAISLLAVNALLPVASAAICGVFYGKRVGVAPPSGYVWRVSVCFVVVACVVTLAASQLLSWLPGTVPPIGPSRGIGISSLIVYPVLALFWLLGCRAGFLCGMSRGLRNRKTR
ncbi:hypothetical protein [Paracoccus sp. SCSIO 75233]|uniref:hypothetical protein n=1 Tax=Paracoccus sp. SCSIO 75233 TaxID=3017782 RepID=UPI0022F137C7|nr:hypothetical protein [Paracoccus sp. SCSIO 75233]WBU54013.1 hypothetical protein PAF12_04030 [Paracoccus sp. SCSIO 75233]